MSSPTATEPTLTGRVALVTGGSRGIGKGIALALGAAGATVYVTGRPRSTRKWSSGTIHETAAAVDAAGGHGIAMACDHADDEQVADAFAQIKAEQGRLDLLVNNATALAPEIIEPPPFWNKPLTLADEITVGLRSSYVATVLAAPLLLESTHGLVVNISYYGSVSYYNDPAYGAAKAGTDKMTYDMAQDFAPYGVSVISLWPGPTMTEMAVALLPSLGVPDEILADFETPAFSGRVVVAMYGDDNLARVSGQVMIAAEAARAYGITEADGRRPPALRDALGSPVAYPH